MTRLQAAARRLKMTQLCISQCNFSSLGAIILKITEIKFGRTNFQVFHHLISCTKPIQRHATAFLTGSHVLGWGVFTVRVPQEATDALEVESGGERGETVTAALQTQNDRRSLQLHLDQLYPQQRKSLTTTNNDPTTALCTAQFFTHLLTQQIYSYVLKLKGWNLIMQHQLKNKTKKEENVKSCTDAKRCPREINLVVWTGW